jgi:hypothetical protein
MQRTTMRAGFIQTISGRRGEPDMILAPYR